MDTSDLTIEVLKGIRSELVGLRTDVKDVGTRLDQTNERLDQTNERLDQTNEWLDRLEQRQRETELRLSTELVEVAKAIGDIKDLLQSNLAVKDQVDSHERRLTVLETRLGT